MPHSIDIRALLKGDRNALSRAITFIESKRLQDKEDRWNLLEEILPHTGNSIRIAVSGSPGVGKSSFIDALGAYLIQKGHKVGVLAIDPSSSKSGGSILGDRTRMERISNDPSAFIRPSPTANTLGGVAAKSREVILLMEAAGHDIILVETVGVGQSEITVRDMVDYFILLIQPGSGDELQGIKRGIVEMADLIVINKADGEHLPLAKKSLLHYSAALHLFPLRESQVPAKAIQVSSTNATGINAVWDIILHYKEIVTASGYFDQLRSRQEQSWLLEGSQQILLDYLSASPKISSFFNALRDRMKSGDITLIQAIKTFDQFLKNLLN